MLPYTDVLLTVVPLLFGLLIKFWPALKSIPNAAIPYVGFALALLTRLAEGSGGLAPSGFVHASLLGGLTGFLAPVLSAGWTAIQNSLIYEVFLRHPLANSGWKKT